VKKFPSVNVKPLKVNEPQEEEGPRNA